MQGCGVITSVQSVAYLNFGDDEGEGEVLTELLWCLGELRTAESSMKIQGMDYGLWEHEKKVRL